MNETKRHKAPTFRLWALRMGFDAPTLKRAGDLLGMKSRLVASRSFSGARDVTKTELLAMSAVRAGLKPWSLDYDDELLKVREQVAPSNGG